MHFTYLAFGTAMLASLVAATPVAAAEASPIEVAARATYTIHCTGGQNPDSHCLTPHSKCDSYGTYLVESGYKDQCKKCGCQKS
ncbi:hypothetical protein BO71DRAFT_398797 [Aspergillus ellipticus CBS 707.79]|uniref:Uncharacterized protein n=1 Tax=Aspergillus ellipticus CBS 707.79 TaxID=1448320 RepID=A0A319DAT9_9EURO|nr:hypothetical protein BO71DRAFT_398797 [Aspergillus ellipticus CBS 707.79]